MKNLLNATIIVLGFVSLLGCRKDEVETKTALNENMTEIEMLESTSGKQAFKKTVDVVSADGLQTYSV